SKISSVTVRADQSSFEQRHIYNYIPTFSLIITMLRPEALYSMFVEDPHVLERMDGAAAAGNNHFAMEMASLKPWLARKLNHLWLSPHARGFVGGIAIDVLFGWLRLSNKEQILKWKDDDGNTALHMRISRVHWKYHIN
ncbi:hypothetical protein CISIN_1g035924mg, partial [Citrus sinensis]